MADDTVTVRGAGGSSFTFDLPLPDNFANQVLKGQLQAVSQEDSQKLAYLYGDEPTETEDVESEDVVLEEPQGNASRDAWAAYADQEGVAYSDDDGRNDIRDAVQASA